jgi:hypothetical protein
MHCAHKTKEELLETVFSTRSAQRLNKGSSLRQSIPHVEAGSNTSTVTLRDVGGHPGWGDGGVSNLRQ